MTVQVDTGSSDLWLNSQAAAGVCVRYPSDCADFGVFNKKTSSSIRLLKEKFHARYEDQKGADGEFVTDAISIGGKPLPDVQFGLASNSLSYWGIFGLGNPEDQSGMPLAGIKSYPTIPQILFDRRLIKVKAFSLWLGGASQSSGSLLFGGVDTAKLQGKFVTLPIRVKNKYVVFANEISFSSTAGSKSTSGNIRLDSGYTLNFLPRDLVNVIYRATKAVIAADGSPYIECKQSSLSLDFTFGSMKFRIPISRLVWNRSDPPQGAPPCLLGILPITDGHYGGSMILGIPFLQNMYTVFDMTNNQISIAQAKSTSASNIVELGVGGVGQLGNLGADRPLEGDEVASMLEENPFDEGLDTNLIGEASESDGSGLMETEYLEGDDLQLAAIEGYEGEINSGADYEIWNT